MIVTNRQVNRWTQLLEFDIKKLKEGLIDFDESPSAQTQAYMAGGKYDLMPATKDGIQRQIKEDEENLKEVINEVDKRIFEFGLSSKKEDIPVQKGLSIR